MSGRSEQDKQALEDVGYLLIVVGFPATFALSWMVVGLILMWVGCGLGLEGSRLERWRNGLGIAVVLTLLGAIIGVAGTSAPPIDDAPGAQPFLVVTVQAASYAEGELRITGVVTNAGPVSAFSPSIDLIVFGEFDDVPLDEDTGYPEGRYERQLSRDEEGPFELVAFPDDEPERIRWVITVNDYPGEVVQQGLRLGAPVFQTTQSVE